MTARASAARVTFAFLTNAILLVCPSVYGGSGQITKQTFESGGKSRIFYLFVPDGVTEGPPVPLLVTLHGSGRDGRSLVESWKNIASKEGIILVGPNAENPAGWAAPADGPDLLRDIVEHVKTTYPINPRKLYLFGHSAGAVFAIAISMWESQYFAATAVHAGALRTQFERAVISEGIRKIPLIIFAGTADPLFPLGEVRATRDALQQAGFPVEREEMQGHNHDYYRIASKVNRNAWNFLRKQELPFDPKYEHHSFH